MPEISLQILIWFLILINHYEFKNICQANLNLISALPFFDKSEFPCLYNDHIELEIKSKYQKIHYIFIEERIKKPNQRILIWINENNSLINLFSGISPFKVIKIENKIVGSIDDSLLRTTSFLFIDNLFNFDSSENVSVDILVSRFVKVIQSIFRKNDIINNYEVILAGEGKSANLIPEFAMGIIEDNQYLPKIKISKLLIGNSLELYKNEESNFNLMKGLNILSDEYKIQIKFIRSLIKSAQTEKHINGKLLLENFITKLNLGFNIFEYSIKNYFTESESDSGLLNEYLSNKFIQKIFEEYQLNEYSGENNNYLTKQFVLNKYTIEKLQNEYSLDMIIYNGNLNLGQSSTHLESFLNSLNISKKLARNKEIWSIKKDSENYENVGYIKIYSNNLLYINIRNSGSKISISQNSLVLFLYDSLIHTKTLKDFNHCDSKNKNCDLSHYQCKALNNCNNNGICADYTKGICRCLNPYVGADCSILPELTTEFHHLHLEPKEIKVFKFSDDNDYYVEINNYNKFEFYFGLAKLNEIHLFEKHSFRMQNEKEKSKIFLKNEFISQKYFIIKNLGYQKADIKIHFSTGSNLKYTIYKPGNLWFLFCISTLTIGTILFIISYLNHHEIQEFQLFENQELEEKPEVFENLNKATGKTVDLKYTSSKEYLLI